MSVSQLSPSMSKRLAVRLHRRALDAQLAVGAEPEQSPELWVRAQQLCDLPARRALGRTLAKTTARARRDKTWLSSAIPVSRDAVNEALPALAQLEIALRSPEPVRPQGVAQVLELLRDGAGPLYVDNDDHSALYYAARRALLAMRPCTPCAAVELVEHGEHQEVR
jgi:hypothetical protein